MDHRRSVLYKDRFQVPIPNCIHLLDYNELHCPEIYSSHQNRNHHHSVTHQTFTDVTSTRPQRSFQGSFIQPNRNLVIGPGGRAAPCSNSRRTQTVKNPGIFESTLSFTRPSSICRGTLGVGLPSH